METFSNITEINIWKSNTPEEPSQKLMQMLLLGYKDLFFFPIFTIYLCSHKIVHGPSQ